MMRTKLDNEDKVGQENQGLTAAIREWVISHRGQRLDTRLLDNDLGIFTKTGKQYRSKVIKRLIEEGEIYQGEGYLRIPDKAEIKLDFKTADPQDIIPLKWPRALIGCSTFGLERCALLYPKSIIVLAGVKSGGKTAFVMNFMRENMESDELRKYLGVEDENEPLIKYMTNELCKEELADRLMAHDDLELSAWKIDAIERRRNHADVIAPNKINIIDNLEINSEFTTIADLIDEIHERLDRGVAFIVMHKYPGVDSAIGKLFTEKRARLYMLMDKGKLTIKYAKKQAAGGESIEGKAWNFKLVNGAKFVSITEVRQY